MTRRAALIVATSLSLASSQAAAYFPVPTQGWTARPYGGRFSFEYAVGSDLAVDVDRGEGYVGGTARWALMLSDSPMGGSSLLGGAFLGDAFGLELRAHALVATLDASTLVTVGLAPVLLNVASTWVRVPSIFGAVVPEVGVAVRAGEAHFYLRWEVAVSVLLNNRVALEARPSVSLLDGVAPDSGAGVLASFSLGVLLR